MTGPSNRELFDFLANDLAFSVFERRGDVLRSFKTTVELELVPDGTAEGPPEGLLFEGVAPMSHGEWLEFAAGFAMSAVESSHDADGALLSRAYRATENGEGRLRLLRLRRAEPATPAAGAVTEELVSDRARYVWTGRSGEAGGEVAVHARLIACRGADAGMSARALLAEKLAAYRRRRPA